MRVDLKSFLLGTVLVLILFIAIGQTTKKSYPVGRFQIFMPHTDNQIPFLLDTKTGQAWKYLTSQQSSQRGWGWTVTPFLDSLDDEIHKTILNNY